jgi:ubiquinone/menaquinone biosynthesis C-methylase UbiE
MPADRNIDVFDEDVLKFGGYVYTTNMHLSSRMATQRTVDIILETGYFANHSVLDMGCGDGYYTTRFWDIGKPRSLTGVDAATYAIKAANANKANRPIKFMVGNAHNLPWADYSFDVVMIQSILHHDDDPEDMIREAFRLAPVILIHEPNGNNPGLKVIEKLSHYHRAHGEKSYTSLQFNRWIKEKGGETVYRKFAGFVPMFCPDWIALLTKQIEPIIEKTPLICELACSVVVLVAKKKGRA